jgi:sulfur carrier protein
MVHAIHKGDSGLTISVNGKKTIIPENPARTIESLLEELEIQQRRYVTVELNGEILERTDFETTPVNEHDVIEFLYFMGGGGE